MTATVLSNAALEKKKTLASLPEEHLADAGMVLCDVWAASNVVLGFLREFNT